MDAKAIEDAADDMAPVSGERRVQSNGLLIESSLLAVPQAKTFDINYRRKPELMKGAT